MSVHSMFMPRLLSAVRGAFMPALGTAVWVVKLTLPITLGVAVLDYLGVVAWLSSLAAPLFALMGLDGDAALVFITTALANLYSGVAVMATVGVDLRSAVILATMGLICHNLIIETAVQKKAMASGYIALLRIGVSLLGGFLLNIALPDNMTGRLLLGAGVEHMEGWGGVLADWALTMLPLTLKMLALILSLNILQGILREFGILKIIAWPLRPLMKVFGLPESTSFLWIICNVIGITYGGAAVMDEVRRGGASPQDARLLNTHVAISHSMLEDTLLFVSLGLPVFIVVVPRLILAVAAVWLQRLCRRIIGRRL